MSSSWKQWNKDDYHPNFDRRKLARKKRVKYTCESCGKKQMDERLNKQGRPYKVIVSAAHLNHDPWNARAKLMILCQVCHKQYDRYDHADKARRTRGRKKREAQTEVGQLEMFEETKQKKLRVIKFPHKPKSE